MFEQTYHFNQLSIKQQKGIATSREDINIESEIIKGIKRPIPLIAANMNTVVNPNFIIQLYKFGSFGIMHRAEDKTDRMISVKKISNECEWCAMSIGLNDDYDYIGKLIYYGANILNIDIAHSYNDWTMNMAKTIKIKWPHVKLIIGNTTNPKMLEECYDYIDAIKIGIGQGSACETKNSAGCTMGMATCVQKFNELSKKYGIPIISDGSVKEPADFVKAIGLGASSVMAGRIFASCPESAAKVKRKWFKKYKVYSGMASRDVQEKWRGRVSNNCPEGKTVLLPIGESAERLLQRYEGALRSGISYAGFDNIKNFKGNAEFILV